MSIVKLAVIGSRGFSNYNLFCEKLEYLTQDIKEDIIYVSGGCPSGGDALIKRYTQEKNLSLIEYLPDWDKFGKKAGFLRNKLIIDDATHLIAFWDSESKGTLSSIKMAEKKDIPIKIIKI